MNPFFWRRRDHGREQPQEEPLMTHREAHAVLDAVMGYHEVRERPYNPLDAEDTRNYERELLGCEPLDSIKARYSAEDMLKLIERAKQHGSTLNPYAAVVFAVKIDAALSSGCSRPDKRDRNLIGCKFFITKETFDYALDALSQAKELVGETEDGKTVAQYYDRAILRACEERPDLLDDRQWAYCIEVVIPIYRAAGIEVKPLALPAEA